MSLTIQSLSAASDGDTVALTNLQRQVNLHNCYDKFGATPVHYASRAGKVNCVKWLVEIAGLSGTRPANNGATPAHDAAATGQLECLKWLIDYGGCSEAGQDACGATPLHLGIIMIINAESAVPDLYFITRGWAIINSYHLYTLEKLTTTLITS